MWARMRESLTRESLTLDLNLRIVFSLSMFINITLTKDNTATTEPPLPQRVRHSWVKLGSLTHRWTEKFRTQAVVNVVRVVTLLNSYSESKLTRSPSPR